MVAITGYLMQRLIQPVSADAQRDFRCTNECPRPSTLSFSRRYKTLAVSHILKYPSFACLMLGLAIGLLCTHHTLMARSWVRRAGIYTAIVNPSPTCHHPGFDVFAGTAPTSSSQVLLECVPHLQWCHLLRTNHGGKHSEVSPPTPEIELKMGQTTPTREEK